jgi:hypothetical protein
MFTPRLKTKIHIFSPLGTIVTRGALSARLNAGLDKRLTLDFFGRPYLSL